MSANSNSHLCRTCLTKDKNSYSLWQEVHAFDPPKILKELLTECTSILINKTDNLPSGMCEICFKKLVESYEFRVLCRESNEKLQAHVNAKNDDHSYCKTEDDHVIDSTATEPAISPRDEEDFADQDSTAHLTDSDETHTCRFCKKIFNTKNSFNKHIKLHRDNTDLICKVCGKQFTRAFDVKRHMSLHTGLKPYSCNICLASFTQSGSLMLHKRKHHEFKNMQKAGKREGVEKPHLCNICGMSFKDSSSLTVHIRRHTGEKPYECKSCGMSTNNFSAICEICEQTHSMLEEESPIVRVAKTVTITSFTCNKCNTTFSKASDLHLHAIREHPETPKPVVPLPKKCDTCRIKFSRASTLRKHLQKKHPDKLCIVFPKKQYTPVIACNHCNKSFANKSNLNKHIRAKHIADDTVVVLREDGINKYQCKKCGGIYDNKKESIEHVRLHLHFKQNKLFKCALCEHNDSDRKGSINHLIEQHNVVLETETSVFANFEEFQKWKKEIEYENSALYVSSHGSYKTNDFVKFKYFCDRSGAKRQTEGGRRMKASKKIDAFCPSRIEVRVKADKCEVTFVKTHIGHEHGISGNEELYCRFVTSGRLTTHRRIHTGERPFVCKICGKTFAQSSVIAKHMKTHTGDRSHQCTVCGKAFSTLYCLNVHKRQHTGEKPHCCSICEKRFADPKVLKQHIRIHSDERSHLCSICGKGFRRTHHLKTHMITHSKGAN